MKLIKFIMIISAFMFILYGCKGKTTNDNTNNSASSGTSTYKDGTYDQVHKSTKPGYEEAVVTIQNGKIQNIVLKRLDDNKAEINYDEWDGTGEYPNLKKDRIDLANAMLSKQSPEVDAISGATQSCNGWKAAVTDALAQAKK